MVKDEKARPDFDDFARSLHASCLDRWNRHDPAALERLAKVEVQRRLQVAAGKEKTSAA